MSSLILGFSLSRNRNIKATNAKQNNKNISPVHSIILYRTEPISFWNVRSFLPNVQISHILFRGFNFPRWIPVIFYTHFWAPFTFPSTSLFSTGSYSSFLANCFRTISGLLFLVIYVIFYVY